MQLFFIRHAQSTNNALYTAGKAAEVRFHDPRLTDLGLRQAEHLAEALAQTRPDHHPDRGDSQNRAGFGLTHLYCSLMVRAVQTGSAVAARLGLPLRGWVDWHEEGGLFRDGDDGERLPEAGPGRADLMREFPALSVPAGVDDAGWWNRPFEEPEARPVRARRVLAELVARHGETDDRVAVVSHGGFYNHLMGALQDIQPPYRLNYLMNNTGITRVALTPEGNYAVYQNRCEHLPAGMVTY